MKLIISYLVIEIPTPLTSTQFTPAHIVLKQLPRTKLNMQLRPKSNGGILFKDK